MLATNIPKLGQRIKIDYHWTTKSDQLLYVCIENVHYGKFKDRQEVRLVVKLFNNNSHFYFVTDIFTSLERKYPFELYIFLFFNESFPELLLLLLYFLDEKQQIPWLVFKRILHTTCSTQGKGATKWPTIWFCKSHW